MESLTYILVYMLQTTLKYATSHAQRKVTYQWKTSEADKVQDYYNHGPVFIPGLERPNYDVFDAWFTNSSTSQFNIPQNKETEVTHDNGFDTTTIEYVTDSDEVTKTPKTIIKKTIDTISDVPKSLVNTTNTETLGTTPDAVEKATTIISRPIGRARLMSAAEERSPNGHSFPLVQDDYGQSDIQTITKKTSTVRKQRLTTTTTKMTISEKEQTVEPFSLFLKKLLIILSVKRSSDLRRLVNGFTNYVLQLIRIGQLEMLGAETVSFITKMMRRLKHSTSYNIRKDFGTVQLMLVNRKHSDELFDYVDDLYDADEEVAMQAVLNNTSTFPDNGKTAQAIAHDLVDHVFLMPINRLTETRSGNKLFFMITENVKKIEDTKEDVKPYKIDFISETIDELNKQVEEIEKKVKAEEDENLDLTTEPKKQQVYVYDVPQINKRYEIKSLLKTIKFAPKNKITEIAYAKIRPSIHDHDGQVQSKHNVRASPTNNQDIQKRKRLKKKYNVADIFKETKMDLELGDLQKNLKQETEYLDKKREILEKNEASAKSSTESFSKNPGFQEFYSEFDQRLKQKYGSYMHTTRKRKQIIKPINDFIEDFKNNKENLTNNNIQELSNENDQLAPEYGSREMNGKRAMKHSEKIKPGRLVDFIDFYRRGFQQRHPNTTTDNRVNVVKAKESSIREKDMRKFLQEAFRSVDLMKLNAFRNLTHKYTSIVDLQKESQETDLEAVLKTNIYKTMKRFLKK